MCAARMVLGLFCEVCAEKWLSYALPILADLSVTLGLTPLSPFYKSLSIIGRTTRLLKMYCTGEALPGFRGFSGATSLPDTGEMGLLMGL